ncbi:MAG TPA: dipeptidase [Anaerolineae bacterium]|nr:dipeptidase [Anaerolineae bacterium]
MNDLVSCAIKYSKDNFSHFLNELKEILQIPSISTDASHVNDMQNAAQWLADHLKNLGINRIQIIKTKKHPIVYGEYLEAGRDKPTVLIYGHYDVQPPDPLELWKTMPFKPAIDGDYLYGRGSSDMKGQVMVSLAAVESIMKTTKLPVNLKFLIEGEEEIGSPSIEFFLEKNRGLLNSNVALNLDAGMINANTPTIVYGLRGLAYFEIHITGPGHDLHSGLFGGIVYNPAQALCELLAGMKDKNGVIQLPGFYDQVISLNTDEKRQLAELPLSDAELLRQTGVEKLWGEKGFTSIERISARPTLEIHGILTGYTGEGSKTIIPCSAMAKISTRLVSNQTPDVVHQQLIQYLEKKAPNYIRWDVKRLASDPACIIDCNFYATKCFSKALKDVWGKKPVYKRGGGSIPIVAHMQKILGIKSVLSGFGLPDDRIHSPNERLHLPTWKHGIETTIRFFDYLGKYND